MPYVSKERRAALASGDAMQGPGDLAFILTAELERYRRTHGDCFQTYSDMLGALEATKLEAYRRVIARYEDAKRMMPTNGEVYATFAGAQGE